MPLPCDYNQSLTFSSFINFTVNMKNCIGSVMVYEKSSHFIFNKNLVRVSLEELLSLLLSY